MAINDPLGDLLTRIRNGQKAGMQKVASPASKLRANVLEVLKREGYIRDFSMDASMPGGEITKARRSLRRSTGSPSLAAVSIRRSPTCRATTTVSGFRSSRPRAA
jgi:small subunit ribosomal protein S8